MKRKMKTLRKLKNNFLAGSAILLAAINPVSSHKFHMSLTEVEYHKDDHSIAISHRLFSDDLERAIQEHTTQEKLNSSFKLENSEKQIESYIKRNFRINNKGIEQDFKWVGYEINVDIVWIYLEKNLIQSIPNWKDFEVCSSILNSLFDDQINLVTIKSDNSSHGLTFRKADCKNVLD